MSEIEFVVAEEAMPYVADAIDGTDVDLTVRLDKWLWAARFFKTRALARTAVESGRVLYNGVSANPGMEIEVGSTITININRSLTINLVIRGLSTRRRNANDANDLYTEIKTPIANNAFGQRRVHNPYRRIKNSPSRAFEPTVFEPTDSYYKNDYDNEEKYDSDIEISYGESNYGKYDAHNIHHNSTHESFANQERKSNYLLRGSSQKHATNINTNNNYNEDLRNYNHSHHNEDRNKSYKQPFKPSYSNNHSNKSYSNINHSHPNHYSNSNAYSNNSTYSNNHGNNGYTKNNANNYNNSSNSYGNSGWHGKPSSNQNNNNQNQGYVNKTINPYHNQHQHTNHYSNYDANNNGYKNYSSHNALSHHINANSSNYSNHNSSSPSNYDYDPELETAFTNTISKKKSSTRFLRGRKNTLNEPNNYYKDDREYAPNYNPASNFTDHYKDED